MSKLQIKRVYELADKTDGCRVLVDRLWPRGLTRKAAAIDKWLKELGPSTALRKWFGHMPERWNEFVRRYRKELSRAEAQQFLRRLKVVSNAGPLTLLYSARDKDQNQAVVIAAVLRRLRL